MVSDAEFFRNMYRLGAKSRMVELAGRDCLGMPFTFPGRVERAYMWACWAIANAYSWQFDDSNGESSEEGL